MAKAPGKSDDSIRNKLKNLFGIKGTKSGSDQLGQVRQYQTEFTFTPENIKDLGPDSPPNNRFKLIKELSEIIQSRRLEQNAIEVLWNCIQDLVQVNAAGESRRLGLRFLTCLIKGQYQNLGMMRRHFFQVIRKHDVFEDLAERLELFCALSQAGKDLLHFEEEAGPFLLSWMRDVMSSSRTADFLSVLVNLIKYNAAYMDEEVINGIILNTCVIATKTGVEAHIRLCLMVLDTIVCYSYLPHQALHHFLICMCQIISVEKFCQDTWKLVKKLLGTHLGHSAIYTMCCILQDKSHVSESGVSVRRGAVYFISMALWGSQRVHSLKHPPVTVLPAFSQAVEHSGSDIVAYEVVVSLQRLVNKFGSEQQPDSWDMVVDLIEVLLTHIEVHPKCNPMVVSSLHDLLTSMETLLEQDQYCGSRDKFFSIIERCAQKRPETSILMLVSHEANVIEGDRDNMIALLNRLMDKYFVSEGRTKIRLKVLDVVSYVLSSNRLVCEDELLECVVLPYLHNIDTDSDSEVRARAARLLVDITLNSQSQYSTDLLDLLRKIICWPFTQRQAGSGPSSPVPPGAVHTLDRQHRKMSYKELEDLNTAIHGLVRVFKTKLFEPQNSCTLKSFELLINFLKEDYNPKHLRPRGGEFRKIILENFLDLRADGMYRLGVSSSQQPTSFSPYAICMYREELSDPEVSISGRSSPSVGASPAASPQVSQHQGATVVPYSEVFHCVTLCLQQEMDWSVLKSVFEKLPPVLQNKTLVLAADRADLDAFCARLISMISERGLGVPEKLLNSPQRFTKSDFHGFLFPALTCLVSHHTLLEKSKQRELVKCLEFGLVSPCALICIRALTVCAIEDSELMMRQLPAVLLKLSQISATTSLSIPLMEMLSTLIHLPQLYSNFVEEQYRSIFAIALPYTNPFKYSHYTVSLSYHVISMWFLKCRLSFRKGFVGFIAKGLRANVLRQFEETAAMRQRLNNQDSAERNRAQSLNEEAMRSSQGQESTANSMEPSKGNRTAAKLAKSQTTVLQDEAMCMFHRELTETCIDMMARYTFSTFSSLPKRSPVTDFLLAGGQKQSWLLGNKIITITTSGGAKVSKSGLCEKCLTVARTASTKMEEEQVPPTSGRRRHKSAAVRTMSESVDINVQCVDDMHLFRRENSCYGNKSESSLPRIPSEGLESSEDLSKMGTGGRREGGRGGRLLESRSAKIQAVDNVLMALKPQPSDTSIFSPHICSCWCTQWAEVHIRRPTGNTAWMMRIENEQDLAEVFPDLSLADLSSLFMGGKERREQEADKQVEQDYFGEKIDSSHLGEHEYETLLEQHFHGNCDAFMRAVLSSSPGEDTPADVFTEEPSHKPQDNVENQEGESLTGSYIRKTASSPDLNPSIQQFQQLHVSSGDLTGGKEQRVVRANSARNSASDEVLKVDTSHHSSGGQLSTGQFCSGPLSAGQSNSGQLSDGGSLTSLTTSPSRPSAEGRRPRGSTLSSLSDESTGPSLDMQRPMSMESLPSPDHQNKPVVSKVPVGKPPVSKPPATRSPLKPEFVQGGLNPSFVFLQLFFSHYYGREEERPILLPNQERVSRSMKLLDLIYPYETHKLGVLYVGPGQAGDQTAILSNRFGSARYIHFLKGLGHMIRLPDSSPGHVYLGGLHQHGNDGEFAYAWHDEFMQVIFHVATMMPYREKDPNCNAKKAHIGNDYVTIVYNDSAEAYQLGTIKGQFNYINIVIQPQDHNTNAVIVLCKPEIEAMLGFTETKMVSDTHLSLLVRQMAVHADLASTIMQKQQNNPKDLYASNWLERLRHIKRMRSKVEPEEGGGASGGQGQSAGQQGQASGSLITEDFTDYI